MTTKESMPTAVILAGGEGKRLRPLTATTPKPLLPLAGKPLIYHTLRRLESMGVERAYVMTGYLSEAVERAVKQYSGRLRPICLREEAPLGSAGCFSLIPELSHWQSCLVVSGDAYFEFDLRPAVALAKEKNAAAVLCLARVEQPLAFGLVQTDREGRITRFTEKPTWSRTRTDCANTGIYVLGRQALAQMEKGSAPLDFGADVFPALVEEGAPLYGYTAQGFWCDVGTASAYLQCNLRLTGGRNVIGSGTKLAATAQLSQSVLLDGVQVGAGATVRGAVIGENSIVGDGCTLEQGTVIGASVVIGDRSRIGRGVMLPAGTIVASGSVLQADCDPESGVRFEEGRLYVQAQDPLRCGRRIGRAFSALTGRGICIGLMREHKKGQSEFVKGLAAGILAGGSDLLDLGWGFPAKASYAATVRHCRYTLLVYGEDGQSCLHVFDENGLYPDARFERRLLDYIRELPKESERCGEISIDRELGRRYRTDLRRAAGGERRLTGLSVTVHATQSDASEILSQVLADEGAELSAHGEIAFALDEQGKRVETEICGMKISHWQTFGVLALEQVKRQGEVLLPYCCPEAVKRAVFAAGARVSFYTLFPENGFEDPLRRRLLREQPFVGDGLFAASRMAFLVATGRLRAGELAGICDTLCVGEEDVALTDSQKLQMIVSHQNDFDGEGLCRRYRRGCVRVRAGADHCLHLMAEAAQMEDVQALLEKVKKEIHGEHV